MRYDGSLRGSILFGRCLLCLVTGFIIALLAWWLLPSAWQMPGGSIGGAFTVGYATVNRYHPRFRSALFLYCVCILAGFLGWLCALPIIIPR